MASSARAHDLEDSTYQRLSEIFTRLDSDYEDPTVLLARVSRRERELSDQAALHPPRTSAAPWSRQQQRRDNIEESSGSLAYNPGMTFEPDGGHYSDVRPLLGEESDSSGNEDEAPCDGFSRIPQSHNGHGRADDRLYVSGSLSSSSQVRRGGGSEDEGGGDGGGEGGGGHSWRSQLEEDGVMQGMVLSNFEKWRMGILPDHLYMTGHLERKGEELEDMSVKVCARPVVVPDNPFDPNSQMPLRRPPPEPRVHQRASSSSQASAGPPPLPAPPIRISPFYRDNILRPPPLPPLMTYAHHTQRKAFAVVDNILKSEAAFLTSLNIAVKVYQQPLEEFAGSVSPILPLEQVERLFGPISKLVGHHELFYSALTARTMAWSPSQCVGDVFLSSFHSREVVKNYSKYVNNFTDAMAALEKAIRKRPKFVTFLRSQYGISKTSLSLQGLLLKPIQRFPQYILFLQDVLKFTGSTHPDRIHLEMALAHLEGIADFLNEAKRRREQSMIVECLSSRVSRLPFRLTDSQRWLHRQDVVTRLMYSGGRLTVKRRSLLLFDSVVLCVSIKGKPSSSQLQTPSSLTLRSSNGVSYTCKWHCAVDKLQVVEPDYHRDIWDDLLKGANEMSESSQRYYALKEDHQKLVHDFLTLMTITRLVSSLNQGYTGLQLESLQTSMRMLQLRLARNKEQIKREQCGRLDFTIPSRDGSRKALHTYLFESERSKREWINTLRLVRLKKAPPNANAWVFAEELDDDIALDTTHKPPLFVQEYHLGMDNNYLSVRCATVVGNQAWFISNDGSSAQVTVVECVTPAPLILESFRLDSARAMTAVCVPPAVEMSVEEGGGGGRGGGGGESGGRQVVPPYHGTVWIGDERGQVFIYTTGSKALICSLKLSDSITCIEYFCDVVFIGTAEGTLVVVKRNSERAWDLSQAVSLPLEGQSILCLCGVHKKVWVGVGSHCHVINPDTLEVEASLQLCSEEGVSVARLACSGGGVWASFRGKSMLELFHASTLKTLQVIDIQTTLSRMARRERA